MTSLASPQPFAVDEKQIAGLIGMSVAWLRKDRATKRTIPFFRLGDCIRYDVATVRSAVQARMEGGHKVSKQGVAA